MKSKIIGIIAGFIVAIGVLLAINPIYANAVSPQKVLINLNNDPLKKVTEPYIKESVEYYPVNEIYPEVGYKFIEVVKGQKISLRKNDKVIILSTKDRYIFVNGKKIDNIAPLVYRAPNYFIAEFSLYNTDELLSIRRDKKSRSINVTYYFEIGEYLSIIADRYYNGAKDQLISGKENRLTFEEGKKILTKIIKPEMTQLEKEYTIYDYVTRSVMYDHDTYKGVKVSDSSYYAYGAIVLKKAVCGGIAEGVNFLLRMAGIESKIVVGTAGRDAHAWNIAKIDGQYYHLDATWDLIREIDPSKSFSYNRFNMTTQEIKKIHNFYENLYPKCNDSKFTFLRHSYNPDGTYNLYKMVRDKDTIYYINADDNKRLYKARTSDDKICVSEEPVFEFWVNSNCIVYLTHNEDSWNYMYKVNKDGGNKQLYKKGVGFSINYTDSIICYTVYDPVTDKDNLYVNNQTLSKEELVAESAYFMEYETISYPYIIYRVFDKSKKDYSQVCSYNINDGSIITLYSGSGADSYTYNGFLYNITGTKIYKISYDGSIKTVIRDEALFGASEIEKGSSTLWEGALYYNAVIKNEIVRKSIPL